MKHLINQMGNIDDIRCAMRNSSHTLADVEAALEDELNKPQPRQTVVKMLKFNIKRRKKEAKG